MIFIPKDVEKLSKKLEKHPEIEEPFGLAVWMKKKGYKMPKKAEEETPEQNVIDEFVSEEEPLPRTPGEQMQTYKPKGTKPTFIDTKPSGQGKPIEEHAEEYNPTKGGKILAPIKKAEEEKKKPKEVPGTAAPKTREYLKERGLLAEEEFDPKQVEMGMKEELEHSETVGHDKEKIRKIVEDHLKEDPQYYTKLHSVMEANEDNKHDKLKELYCFMKWMMDKGIKHPENEEELNKLIDQYDVEHFAKAEEQMQKKPDFDAASPYAPSSIPKTKPVKTMDEPLPPAKITTPRKSVVPTELRSEEEYDGIPTMVERTKGEEEKADIEEMDAGVINKIKKFIDPAPEKPVEHTTPTPMTKHSLRPSYKRSMGAP